MAEVDDLVCVDRELAYWYMLGEQSPPRDLLIPGLATYCCGTDSKSFTVTDFVLWNSEQK